MFRRIPANVKSAALGQRLYVMIRKPGNERSEDDLGIEKVLTTPENVVPARVRREQGSMPERDAGNLPKSMATDILPSSFGDDMPGDIAMLAAGVPRPMVVDGEVVPIRSGAVKTESGRETP